ncbi:MAG: F0F1 ATP synthase subunit A [Myxococcales bacterium]|nr:F0F1 ATP synthase subunit A [Myxococcales bacterium]
MLAAGFSWFRLFEDVDKDTFLESQGWMESYWGSGHEVANTTVHLHAWLSVAVLVTIAILGRMALNRAQSREGIERYFSDEKFTALSAVEVFASGIRSMMSDLLEPKDVKLWFPLIAGLFGYIFLCNIQGILPGFLPPTDNINTNVGMAITSFLVFMGMGLWRDPVNFLKHLLGPVALLAPFMFVVESLSLIIRPIALTIRLTANMFGDHQVFVILSDKVPIILPVGLLTLACLVSVVQAFVFSLLTTIYINLSLPHHEHDAH